MPLPDLGRGEAAEGLALAQAAVVKGLDEGEGLGAGGGPVGPDAGADLFLSRAQKLSAAALSKHDPVRPQLFRSPKSRIRAQN